MPAVRIRPAAARPGRVKGAKAWCGDAAAASNFPGFFDRLIRAQFAPMWNRLAVDR